MKGIHVLVEKEIEGDIVTPCIQTPISHSVAAWDLGHGSKQSTHAKHLRNVSLLQKQFYV